MSAKISGDGMFYKKNAMNFFETKIWIQESAADYFLLDALGDG
jgi:hypothetical protein